MTITRVIGGLTIGGCVDEVEEEVLYNTLFAAVAYYKHQVGRFGPSPVLDKLLHAYSTSFVEERIRKGLV